MKIIGQRSRQMNESITLKLNARAQKMAQNGQKVYNLTAGQLPFFPPEKLVDHLKKELSLVRSFQYSPVPGLEELREKYKAHFSKSRNVAADALDDFSCIVTNGGKGALSTLLLALIDPGDEVLILPPYWVSYPEMVKLCGGETKVVPLEGADLVPSVESVRNSITNKTKVIILNSPNNPSGIHYSEEWMKEFATFLKDFPDLMVINDEIYYHLSYFDPAPSYYYQYDPTLLKQTIVIDGISKFLASTGLRIGFCLAPIELIQAMTKIQGQTQSGANSLIQRALVDFDFSLINEYLSPVKEHLRVNAQILKKIFQSDKSLAPCWYQSTSAFYFFVDFSKAPVFASYCEKNPDKKDFALDICEDLLEKMGLALVPSSDFGVPNMARLSLVLQHEVFEESMLALKKFLISPLN